MAAYYSDENSLLRDRESNDLVSGSENSFIKLKDLANKYLKGNDFIFSKEDSEADANTLFATRYKNSASIKKERLKPYLASSVAFMSSEQRKYWQSLYSEIFIAELYKYNFYRTLNRKQYFSEMEEDLIYYKAQLDFLASFDVEDAKAMPQPSFMKSNDSLITSTFEGTFSPAEWCRNVYDKINTAWNAFLRDSLDELNWYRLYWVWAGGAGGFLGTLLDLEPINQWNGRDRASSRVESPGLVCGTASWGMYVLRLTLHLSLAAKHIIPNPLMTDVEKKVDWTTRFITQLEQRYQRVGNDLAWAYVNYASIYWYTTSRSPGLGAFGGFLNVALMSWDCLMAYIGLSIEEGKYTQGKKAINRKLAQLKDLEESEEKTRSVIALEQDLVILELNWKYDKKELNFILYSAIAFIPAMALLFMPMFPVYFPALVIGAVLMNELIFAGCLLSVLLTAYETYYCGSLSIGKSIELMNGAIEKKALISQSHKALVEQSKADSPQEKNLTLLRQYYLEHKRLTVEVRYFENEQSYLKTKIIFGVSMQLIFPAVIFVSLFAPLAPAIALIASTVLMALAVKLMIEGYKPKAVEELSNPNKSGTQLLCLTEDEYNNPKQDLYFFPKVKKPESKADEPKPSELEEKLKSFSRKKSSSSESNYNDSKGTYGLFKVNHNFIPKTMQSTSMRHSA